MSQRKPLDEARSATKTKPNRVRAKKDEHREFIRHPIPSPVTAASEGYGKPE